MYQNRIMISQLLNRNFHQFTKIRITMKFSNLHWCISHKIQVILRWFHLLNQINQLTINSKHLFKLSNDHPVKVKEKTARLAVSHLKISLTSTLIIPTNPQTSKIKLMLIKMATLHFLNSLHQQENSHNNNLSRS